MGGWAGGRAPASQPSRSALAPIPPPPASPPPLLPCPPPPPPSCPSTPTHGCRAPACARRSAPSWALSEWEGGGGGGGGSARLCLQLCWSATPPAGSRPRASPPPPTHRLTPVCSPDHQLGDSQLLDFVGRSLQDVLLDGWAIFRRVNPSFKVRMRGREGGRVGGREGGRAGGWVGWVPPTTDWGAAPAASAPHVHTPSHHPPAPPPLARCPRTPPPPARVPPICPRWFTTMQSA